MLGSAKFAAGDWCLDSGATDHISCNKELFCKINSLNHKLVEMGDGSTVKVSGVSEIVLEAWNGHEWIETVLGDVPEFKINLFFQGRALDKGFKLKSDSFKSEIVDKTGQVRAMAKRKGKFFKIILRTICENKKFVNHIAFSLKVSVSH